MSFTPKTRLRVPFTMAWIQMERSCVEEGKRPAPAKLILNTAIAAVLVLSGPSFRRLRSTRARRICVGLDPVLICFFPGLDPQVGHRGAARQQAQHKMHQESEGKYSSNPDGKMPRGGLL